MSQKDKMEPDHTFKAPTSSLTPPLVWVDEKEVLRKEGASFPTLQRAGKFSVVPSIELLVNHSLITK